MSSSPWSHPPTRSCDLPSSTGGPSFFLSQPCVPNSFPPLQAGEAGLEGLSSPLGEEGTRSAKSVRGFFRERSGSAGDFAGGRWAVLVVFFFFQRNPLQWWLFSIFLVKQQEMVYQQTKADPCGRHGHVSILQPRAGKR